MAATMKVDVDDFFKGRIERVIREQIENIVLGESEIATKKVEDRIRTLAIQTAIDLTNIVEIERVGQILRIQVHFDEKK